MCRVEWCDPVQLSRSSEQTARKHYRCSECGMVIHPGERYERTFTVMDGETETFFMCQACKPMVSWLFKQCGGTVLGAACEDLREHWWEYPSMELGRLVVSVRKRIRVAKFMHKGFVPGG